MAPFYLSVPVGHKSATVSQYAQYLDPETVAANWNSAIIHLFFILATQISSAIVQLKNDSIIFLIC